MFSWKKSIIIITFLATVVGLAGIFTPQIFSDYVTSNEKPDIKRLEKVVVTYVIDGDTFNVKTKDGKTEKIRPILVDTPEICHKQSPPSCKPDPYGEDAAYFTKQLLEGKTVYLEKDTSDRDRYGRLLRYVYLDDGRMFQELVLEKGLAKVAVYKPDTRYEKELKHIETEAKAKRMNLWE